MGKFTRGDERFGQGCQLQHHHGVEPWWLTGGFDAAEVTNTVFESDVKLVTASTFTERGIISFGDARHRLNFVSAGEG